MDEISNFDAVIDSSAVENLYMLFVAASCLIIFWILETVWRNERRGVIVIFIFPPSILYYIVKYWEETRAKCFFATLLFVIILVVGALTHYSFIKRIAELLQIVAIWPYYLYQQLKAGS